MTYTRLPYEDAASPTQMSADCLAAEAALHLPTRPSPRTVLTAGLVGEPPSIAYEDFPREIHKAPISVSEAAARLAAAMELHLD